ncbi:hypothetical protein SAMN04515647_3535 [Cohaesibacter sp. ES.047]|nr:hypothetical protein SAMN04515647_3535 [Cohaesibacter sp. ES.047]
MPYTDSRQGSGPILIDEKAIPLKGSVLLQALVLSGYSRVSTSKPDRNGAGGAATTSGTPSASSRRG